MNKNLFDVVSTREFAHITVFGFVFLFCFIRSEKVRNNTKRLINLIFDPKIFLILDLFTLYETIILLMVSYSPFWDCSYYKDYFFWLFLCGFPVFLNQKKSKKEFKQMILQLFLYSSIVEFLSGLITFSLAFEFVLCIVCSFIILFTANPSGNKKTRILGETMLGIIGLILTIMTIQKGIKNFNDYKSIDVFIRFLFPICFYFSSLPFIYGFTVYCKYEELFRIIDFLCNKQPNTPNRKKDVFHWCKFNIDKIGVFRKLFPRKPDFTKQEFEEVFKKRHTIDQLQERWLSER